MNLLGAMGGIGAGITAGTKDWRMADEAKKTEAYRQAQLGIMQSQDARAQAADTRSQAAHDIQMGRAKKADKKEADYETDNAAVEERYYIPSEAEQRAAFDAEQSAGRLAAQLTDPAANGMVGASGMPLVQAQPDTFSGVAARQQALKGTTPSVRAEFKPKTRSWLDQMGYITDRMAVKNKHGLASEHDLVQMYSTLNTLKKEGVNDAVKALEAGKGDWLDTFNAVGQYQGAKQVGQTQAGTYDFNGQKIPTTIATIEMPDGSRHTINTAEYKARALSLAEQFDAGMKATEEKRQSDTLKVTEDHYKRSDATANRKAAEGSEATTAEIKNARVFFPEAYKESPAKALGLFQDLVSGEKSAAGIRKSLFMIYEDRSKGGWPTEAGKTRESRDAFLNKRTDQIMGKRAQEAQLGGAPTTGARQGAAVKVSTKQELDALPSGTLYIAPDGSTRTKR